MWCSTVPQGSVFGSTLFIMYVHSIWDSQKNGSTISYADYTAYYYSINHGNLYNTLASIGLNQIIKNLNTEKITLCFSQ